MLQGRVGWSLRENRMSRQCRASALFVLLLLLASDLSVQAKGRSGPASRRWTGPWRGVILVVPAEFELDLALDLSEGPAGALAGRLSLPDQNVLSQKVENLAVEGREIFFAHHDGKDSSLFEGRLSADGKTITGTVKDPGKTYGFVLRRDLHPGVETPVPAVRQLSASGDELRSLFAEDLGKVRLLLILSPT
jgi:hypothetical protein